MQGLNRLNDDVNDVTVRSRACAVLHERTLTLGSFTVRAARPTDVGEFGGVCSH